MLPSLSRVKPGAKPVPVDATANGTGADQIVVPPAQVVYAALLRTQPPPIAGNGAEPAAGVVNFKRFRKARRTRVLLGIAHLTNAWTCRCLSC